MTPKAPRAFSGAAWFKDSEGNIMAIVQGA